VVDADIGASSAVVTYETPAGADNCPGTTVACSPPSGGDFPVGTTTVTCVAVDGAGTDASCSFLVTVNETLAPTATTAPVASPGTGGVTTLPSTGAAPSDSGSDLKKWGPLAAIGGAAAFIASRLRKQSSTTDDEV
jgi:hypothetical protein